jgi:hypothetical protein
MRNLRSAQQGALLKGGGTAGSTTEPDIDPVATFQELIDSFHADTLVTADAVKKIMDYVRGLNALLLDIQGLIKNSDDKTLLDPKALMHKIFDFITSWRHASIADNLGDADAKAMLAQLKNNTYKIVPDKDHGERFALVPTFSGLEKFSTVVSDNEEARKNLITNFDSWVKGEPYRIEVPGGFQEHELTWSYVEDVQLVQYAGTLRTELGVAAYQAETLWTDDLKKTYGTDLQLFLDDYNRQVSTDAQFTKQFASLVQSFMNMYRFEL